MSTNFYYHVNVCEHCTRSDVLHVGKRSSGWTFSFRAYRTAELNIVSVADWARVFKTTAGILVNEYGVIIADPLKFLGELERPTKAVQEDEDSLKRRGAWTRPVDPEVEWRDAEGFQFYDGEFC